MNISRTACTLWLGRQSEHGPVAWRQSLGEDGRALYMPSRQFILSAIAEHGSNPEGEGSKSNKRAEVTELCSALTRAEHFPEPGFSALLVSPHPKNMNKSTESHQR
jgi:hypothetical protein